MQVENFHEDCLTAIFRSNVCRYACTLDLTTGPRDDTLVRFSLTWYELSLGIYVGYWRYHRPQDQEIILRLHAVA